MAIKVTSISTPTVYAKGVKNAKIVKLEAIEVTKREAAPFGTNTGADISVNYGNRASTKWSQTYKSERPNLPDFQAPVRITFDVPSGCVVRYTFNSKKVNFSSTKYNPNHPPVLYTNGNGSDNQLTVLRAKAFRVHNETSRPEGDGKSSDTVEVQFTVTPDGQKVGGRVPDKLKGDEINYNNWPRLAWANNSNSVNRPKLWRKWSRH